MNSVRDMVSWSGMPMEEYISGISGDQKSNKSNKSADCAKRMESREGVYKLCP